MAKYGLYNRNLQAVPPTGSISYINNSTSSIHPIASKIEIRKEARSAVSTTRRRTWIMTTWSTSRILMRSATKIVDTNAVATKYVDEGLSLTLFFKDTATTREVNRAQIYAWRGAWDLVLHPPAPDGAGGHRGRGCVSCML